MKSEESLQKISQCLFDMNEIIRVHKNQQTGEEYKTLHKYFLKEKSKLTDLLKEQAIPLPLSRNYTFLEQGFLITTLKEEDENIERAEALRYLRRALDEVQGKRKDETYITGVENGELKEYLDGLETKNKKGVVGQKTISNTKILSGEAVNLNLRADGLICYQNNIIYIRPKLKTLCEIFIDRPNQLINRDDIKDDLEINSKKTKSTISKYISELNLILKPHSKRKPIVNEPKSGWIFKP